MSYEVFDLVTYYAVGNCSILSQGINAHHPCPGDAQVHAHTHTHTHMQDTNMSIHTIKHTHQLVPEPTKQIFHALRLEGKHKYTQTRKSTLLSMIKGLAFLLQQKR